MSFWSYNFKVTDWSTLWNINSRGLVVSLKRHTGHNYIVGEWYDSFKWHSGQGYPRLYRFHTKHRKTLWGIVFIFLEVISTTTKFSIKLSLSWPKIYIYKCQIKDIVDLPDYRYEEMPEYKEGSNWTGFDESLHLMIIKQGGTYVGMFDHKNNFHYIIFTY